MRAGMTAFERCLTVPERYLKAHGTFETVSYEIDPAQVRSRFTYHLAGAARAGPRIRGGIEPRRMCTLVDTFETGRLEILLITSLVLFVGEGDLEVFEECFGLG